MILLDIVNRNPIPQAWGEGEWLPWENPAFSQRMLEDGDSLDRSAPVMDSDVITRRVDGIFTSILKGRPARVLHLACGDGPYTEGLAKHGCECVGIDISPAAIARAQERAAGNSLSCTYIEHEVYSAVLGRDFDMVMILSGEINKFNPMDINEFFGKAHIALKPGGTLLIEPYTHLRLKKLGEALPDWRAEKQGLFSDDPHLYLHENVWNPNNNTLTKRWYVVDARTSDVRLIARCFQAYTVPALQAMLERRGYDTIVKHDALAGEADSTADDFNVISAIAQPHG